MEQNIRERQEEELQVLQAIYTNEFEDLRSPQQIEAGSPAVVCLKLTPLHSIMRQEIHAKVDLVIKYTTRYPQDPPLLRLENAKGLSKEQISGLKKDLDLQAKELIGEVMVLQLAQSVQAFLHKHNIPTLSFHEQMLKNMQKEKEMRDKETERKLAKDKAQAKEIDDDVNKLVQVALQEREEAMKEERKRRQQSDENRADSFEFGNSGILSSSPNNLARKKSTELSDRTTDGGVMDLKSRGRESIICNRISRQVEIINFSQKLGDIVVHCGKCVGHDFQGACTRSGLDLESGQIVSVCEWMLKSRKAKKKSNLDVDNVYQQVCGMEQEISYLKTKLQHPNLIHYQSICFEKNEDNVNARVLMDYLNGSTLAESVEPPGVAIDLLKDYTKQLVSVLNHLHAKSIAHRDLQPSNVFVTQGNVLRVSGYAVLRRLSDLYNLLQEEGTEQDEFADYRKLVKPGKKGDIFNLGLVVLSLLQGKIATGYPVEIPAGLPEDLQDFLLKCLNIDEKERWTASQLTKHSFLIVQSTPYNFNSSHPADPAQETNQGEGAHDESSFLHSLNELNIPSKTRLVTDFEILESLGKGGFGDVIKARKKLDGLLYAIKRINLNPKSAQLKKRIIREVKLLSRLNHENVVRYYSSWIEAEEIRPDDLKSSETGTETDSSKQRKRTTSSNQTKDENKEDSLMKYNNFEAPSMVADINEDDISWCDDEVKIESSGENHYSDSESSSSLSSLSSDVGGGRRIDMRLKHSSGVLKRAEQRDSSEGVVFKMDDSIFQFGDVSDTDDDSESEQALPSLTTTETNASEATFAQYLYIQMEYCEKSTLRNVIDEGLHKNHDRMWRLFREIIEGLSHVHSQGIIHRDLKPVNIFMDSRDQVKIGDFGLATSHTTGVLDQSMVSLSIASETKTSNESSNRMTGKVGTYLYAAPEIDGLGTKVKISERVDMYSLGIIFFEMCYKPLLTGMERVKVIGMLRTEKIVLPEDFEEKPRPKERKLLFWLLNHSPEERPTANELLESGLIPPKLEDKHFDELLALTLKQTSSTKYKRLTAALFSQNPDPVTEQIYDIHMDQYKEGSLTTAHAYEYVEGVLRELFTQHGAIGQDIPLLLPKCRVFEEYDSIANVMDPEGILLSLPFDSRVGLARYIARNGIYNMKRYNIGKVYRDTKIHRAHPIEIKECSFDIITDSSNSMIPDSEVLYAVEEIIKYFPNIRHRSFYIRMNHTSLLKAILQQAGLDEVRTDRVYTMLQCSKDSKERVAKIKAFLLETDVPEHNVNKLMTFLEFEGPVNRAREVLQSLRKARGQIGQLAKQAFSDLIAVARNAKLFGLELPILVQTNLAYNVNMFSGIVYQFVAENKRKRKHGGVDILAAGGRYDKLIELFRRPIDEQKHSPRAVGVSIAVEKIVNSVLAEVDRNECIPPYLSECNVLVSSIGESSLLEQRLGAMKELWAAGIRAKLSSYDVHHDASLEVLQDYCKEAGINNLLLLKEAEADYVRIRTREKEKFSEVKVARNMMCDYLHALLSEIKDASLTGPKQMQSLPQMPSTSESSLINTTFLLHDKVLAKRRIESQILSKLSSVIQQSFLKTPVEIVVVDLPLNSLKAVFAHLDIDEEDDEFEASVSDIIDRQKQKKSAQYIHRVCSTLREIKRERHVVVLYGFKDDVYRIFV